MGNKVDTTTFNEVKQTVDENSSSITSLSTAVSKKADSSTVETLTNTVNSVKQTTDTNTSSISSMQTTIQNKADSSTVTALSNKTSELEQNLDGFKTVVSKTYTTKTEFDNLEIGGRNLLQGLKWCVKDNPAKTGNAADGFAYIGGRAYLENGKTYTLQAVSDSVWATEHIGQPGKATIWIYGLGDGFHRVFLGDGITSGRYTWTFVHTSATQDCGIRINGYSKVTSFWNIKIESGNKATDWTPAPEDVDGKFANYSTTEQMNSAITQAVSAESGSIKSEISKTYVTNNALSDSLSDIDESIGKLQEDQMYYTKTEQLDNYIKQLIEDDSTETSIVLKGEYTTQDSLGNTLKSYATTASLDLYIKKDPTSGELKSAIEAIADDITLNASGAINISGNKSVNISGNKFSLDSSGTKISSAGYLQTTNAKLGEWNVDSKAIYCETADKVYTAYLQNPDYVVGDTREDAWVYSVQKNGIATFYVTSEGDLYCRSFSTPYTTYQPNYRWATYENSLNTTLFIRTFHGPCLIIANVSIWTDDTSDYGTIKCGLYLDGYCVTENQHRLETTNAIELSAGVTYVWYFSDNEAHTLSGIGGSTKNGKKTITYSVQALFNNDVGWGTGQ